MPLTPVLRAISPVRQASRGGGFSLIEVLVALFIFSIGLLSIGGLQLLSKQANFEAVQRTTAAMLTHDIIERMRANPHALAEYVSYTGATTVGGGTRGSTAAKDCLTSECLPSELAQYDLWQWEQAVDGATEETAAGVDIGGLMLPTGCITGPADGSAGTYVITLAWQGKTELSDTAKSGNTCGAGRYGTGDAYRRLLSITTYIADE